jgi:hypothetical protein
MVPVKYQIDYPVAYEFIAAANHAAFSGSPDHRSP